MDAKAERRGRPAASPQLERAKRQKPAPEAVPLPKANSQPPSVRASNFEPGTVREGSDGTKWRVVMNPLPAWELVVATTTRAVASGAGGGDDGDDDPTGGDGRRSQPFDIGDSVEAVYKEGSWALATVRSTGRARQVQVEYMREEEEETAAEQQAARYLAKENETVRGIALRLGLPAAALLHLNRHVTGLTASASRLVESCHLASHRTPLAGLVIPEARRAPTGPGAQPEQLGSSPCRARA